MKSKVWILSKYNNYYKLINKLKDLNINYYALHFKNEYLYIKINYIDYEKIKKYLPSYEFKIQKYTGIKQILNIIKKYYIFLITLIIGLIIFTILNNLIIKIDIIHENPEIREILSKELKKRGVKVLSFKKSYHTLDNIRKDILNNYKDKLDWIEIETHGMSYKVKVEQRIKINDATKKDYCNIYAKKEGIVSDIVLYKGESIVKIGDYVKVGDLLISGDIIYNDEIKQQTCADGVIKAKKWYKVNISLPLKYNTKIRTGKKRYNIVYENENTKKRILKNRIQNFESININILNLFNNKIYLEKQFETINQESIYNEEEALNKSLELATEKVNIKLKDNESIIDKKILKKEINDSTIEVVILIVTDEIIS